MDGGDCFFSTPTKKAPSPAIERLALRNAKTILLAYNHMGYHALGLGPADLQYGVEKAVGLLKQAEFPVLCANLVEKQTGKPVFKDSVVLKVGGVRFGLYGVLLSSLNRTYKKRILGDKYEILDAVEVTRRIVPQLRKRCDVVVGLSHINIDENFQVAKEVKGVDVIIDPYSRSGSQAVWITEGEYVIDTNGVPVLRIDGQGSRVGVFNMTFRGDSRKFTKYEGYDYPLDPQIFPHPETSDLVRSAQKGRWKGPAKDYDPHKVTLFAESFLGDEACGACHERQFAFWEKTGHKRAYENLVATEAHLRHDCVECHTVAYGVAFVEPAKVGRFKGVQCESCHGINADHAANPKRERLGAVKETTCWGCHNPQITDKPFQYGEARAKTACPRMER